MWARRTLLKALSLGIPFNILRRTILPCLHPYFQDDRPLIREKTDKTKERTGSTEKSISQIATDLRENGFVQNPISTLKYLETADGRVYESLSMVCFSDDYRMQTHVYVFDTGQKREIYAHYEPSIFRPEEHQGGESLTPGDPKEKVPF
jgi:hypothetical protein